MSWRWNVGFGIDIPWNRYGYIGVAGCSKYIGRYANMSRQLSEYGCSSARWHLDFDGPVIDSFFRDESLSGISERRKSELRIWLNHYYSIKAARITGCRRVLLMEDDISFIMDKKVISDAISSIPNDSEIEFYDWRTYRDGVRQLSERKQDGCHWVDASGVPILFFSMVGIGVDGMDFLIDRFENCVFGKCLKNIDLYFRPESNSGLKTYVSFPHIAMQVNTGRSVHAHSKAYLGTVNPAEYYQRDDHAGKRKALHENHFRSAFARRFNG